MAKEVVRARTKQEVSSFLDFVREQGVVGLAIGLLMGVAINDMARSFVDGLIDPLIGLFLPESSSLDQATFTISNSTFLWGSVVSSLIDLLIIALVIYLAFKLLKLDKLDKKKD